MHTLRCLCEKHLSRVFDVFLDLDQEGHSFPAIKQSVVVGESEVHQWSDLDLAINDSWSLLCCVKTKHGGLWEVDDWCAHE